MQGPPSYRYWFYYQCFCHSLSRLPDSSWIEKEKRSKTLGYEAFEYLLA